MPTTQPLSEPTLRLDEARARRNIARMVDKARAAGIRLRPHFKTHQSHTVGRWFREAGVRAITVSSLAMAEYFAADGWHDITIAFPFHPGMRERANALAGRLRLGITIADVDALAEVTFDAPVALWLKIDVGSHRAGFEAEDVPAMAALLDSLRGRSDLLPGGLLAHAGHSYGLRSATAIGEASRDAMTQLQQIRAQLVGHCDRALQISIGDTPGCATQTTFDGADELRPGNFVFFDLSQWQIGSCGIEDIAVAMACPIVARYPRRGRLVVHGGAVHFSKDSMEFEGERLFGLAVAAEGDGWSTLRPDIRLVAISQEHGQVAAPAEFIEACRPGDTLLLLPVHSCLSADVIGELHTLDGQRLPMMKRWSGVADPNTG
jgi:D-serine deaminase-like pyridoxal phosphate-dependent protein